MIDLKELWLQILTDIQPLVQRAEFITYFNRCALLGLGKDGMLVIGVPRVFFMNWHLENTQDKILTLVKKADKKVKAIIFKVDGTLDDKDDPRVVDILKIFPAKNKARKLPGKMEVRLPGGITSRILNPKYTLENFIVGSSNQLTHAACEAVAKKPGANYNPLFIYGGVGLGKTHLLQATGNAVLKHDPSKLVVYVTSETFTNEVVQAMRKGGKEMEKIRKQYREADVLIIDDVQFLAGKDRTQEEFFHTFNTLHEAGKQVIISSDRPPSELNILEPRLRSRFEWGMVTDVQFPDFETRLAILYSKAQNYQAMITPDVFEFIAKNVHHSIRELEGALMQAVAMIELTNEAPTVEKLSKMIKRLNKEGKIVGFEEGETPQFATTLEEVAEKVADYYNLTKSELLSSVRTREISVPRQIAMFLGRDLLNLSLKAIGEFFGGRDHTSVLHSVKKIESSFKSDSQLKHDLSVLKKEIKVA